MWPRFTVSVGSVCQHQPSIILTFFFFMVVMDVLTVGSIVAFTSFLTSASIHLPSAKGKMDEGRKNYQKQNHSTIPVCPIGLCITTHSLFITYRFWQLIELFFTVKPFVRSFSLTII